MDAVAHARVDPEIAGLWTRSDCHEETTHDGISEPCGKLAVAVKDPSAPYPVCKHHATGDMVPLDRLLAATPAIEAMTLDDDEEFLTLDARAVLQLLRTAQGTHAEDTAALAALVPQLAVALRVEHAKVAAVELLWDSQTSRGFPFVAPALVPQLRAALSGVGAAHA